MSHAYIYDHLRTPRGKGKKDGGLHQATPVWLLRTLLKELERRNDLDTSLVDDVVLGCVTPIGEQGADIARTAVLDAEWAQTCAGVTQSRFCASGLESVNLAAAKVASGFERLVVAGGVESMSRVPMGSDGGAWLLDERVVQAVGFVPQERGIFPSLTVRENLTVFARGRSQSGWTLQRIFELFPNLKARERNLGFQLSGGEQQMLSIARALMLNPELLVLDEPSEGLAPMIVEEIVKVLRRLKDEGLAILLVEQNLRAAFAAGDRHHIMNKGEICFTGTSAELEGNEAVLRNYLSV